MAHKQEEETIPRTWRTGDFFLRLTGTCRAATALPCLRTGKIQGREEEALLDQRHHHLPPRFLLKHWFIFFPSRWKPSRDFSLLSLWSNFSKRAAADLQEQQENCWHPEALWASPEAEFAHSEGSAGITRHQQRSNSASHHLLPALPGALGEGRALQVSFNNGKMANPKTAMGSTAWTSGVTFWEGFRCSLGVWAFPRKAGNPLFSAPNLQSVSLQTLCCF